MILNYNIAKPLEAVYATLGDMDKFVDVHPVVYKVDWVEENEYIFYEKINVLFIPFDFKYIVKVDALEKNRNIVMTSFVRKGVLLKLEFKLVPHENYTEVTEMVTIKANLFVRLIFESVLARVHKKLFFNIENK